jgi:hypothetical protein
MKTRANSKCSAQTRLCTPIRELLDGPALLIRLWPDERSRPSLRWLRAQQKLGIIPVIRCGRRALFCPTQVLDAMGGRFTVLPRTWVRDGYSPWNLVLDTLTDGYGLLNWLKDEFGLQRSLRWLRDQQRERTLPFIKISGRVFFSTEQVRFALGRSVKGNTGRVQLMRNSSQYCQSERSGLTGITGIVRSGPLSILGSAIHIRSDLSY